jgi:hypothetical protein
MTPPKTARLSPKKATSETTETMAIHVVGAEEDHVNAAG